MADTRVAYLDASAFVKLVKDEPESAALDAGLEAWPRKCSSALLEVEGPRAARRASPLAHDAARALLGGIELLEIDADIRRAAADLSDSGVRTLDAIHLATALSLGERCGAFFACDERLIAAARAHGLTVTVPRP
jgi:predicted nucleic acid-binding protein